RSNNHLRALRACRVQHEQRESSVAGDQAQFLIGGHEDKFSKGWSLVSSSRQARRRGRYPVLVATFFICHRTEHWGRTEDWRYETPVPQRGTDENSPPFQRRVGE